MARSGYAAAAAAYERAVQLTADPVGQARRLTLAAEAAVEIGDFDRARGLAVRAVGRTTDAVVEARLADVRARADFAQGRPTAHRLLLDGAALTIGRDRTRAVRMLMNALHTAWLVGDPALIADTAERLRSMGGSDADPLAPLVQLMLSSAAQVQQRPGEDLPRLADIVATARRSLAGNGDDLAMVAMVCLEVGRTAEARDLAAALVADARSQGRIGSLPALLTYLAQALVFEGRHSGALATASEALRIAHDTGHTQWTIQATAILAYLAAVEGDQQRCRRLVEAALAEPGVHATSAATPWAPWALGLLELGRGHLDGALVRLETISRGPLRDHASALHSIPDLVEASVRLDQPRRAAEPLTRFSRWARRADTPPLEALVERCHALLEADQDPERHYLAALKLHHEESFEQARTRLLYGTWLRRARRKTQARTHLRAAVDYLDRIHASPWAQRARAELRAAGATTRQPDRAGLPPLTPQELQVARLAAQGLSNRDIAAQLFLSPRTVGYHLYKAYPKLGITSRNQLDPQMLEP
jgi:ATP/maltotriose-dependent transcriptional regulator MalT